MPDPIVSINYHNEQPSTGMTFHSHPYYEIYLFHNGKCRYLIGDKIYELASGDLILMHGMTLHCANVDPQQPYIRTVLHFDPSFIQGAFRSVYPLDILAPFRELGNIRIPLSPGPLQEIDGLLQKIDRLKQKQDAISDNRAFLSLIELLTLLYGVAESKLKLQTPEIMTEKVRNVQSIITYLEKHFAADVHLKQLESKLHLDRHYMSKIFKDVTGITIFTFLYQRRINQAKILLHTAPAMKITEVCYQVGFKHPAHFSRVFKAYTGTTPEQYRKQGHPQKAKS